MSDVSAADVYLDGPLSMSRTLMMPAVQVHSADKEQRFPLLKLEQLNDQQRPFADEILKVSRDNASNSIKSVKAMAPMRDASSTQAEVCPYRRLSKNRRPNMNCCVNSG
jgi:hypothetical protein